MKNTLDVINSKLDNAKEKVSERQTKEIVQSKMKQKKIELNYLWDKHIGIPKGEETGEGQKHI